MQNFALLRALSKVRKPVLVKRGLSATVQEWFLAAEYLLAGGNEQVILCERGIRTFETETRNTLDLAAVALAKQRTHLPVIVDPSHATGNADLILPMALAAVAAGADGLLIEVHPRPEQALCDGHQALTPERFDTVMRRLPALLTAMNRHLSRPVLPAHAAGAR
jgi:3-deoxy-7-phosphoheptulonate synthase